MRLSISIGMLCLAIWLVLTGLLSVFQVSFPSENIVLGLLALAAGILIVLGR